MGRTSCLGGPGANQITKTRQSKFFVCGFSPSLLLPPDTHLTQLHSVLDLQLIYAFLLFFFLFWSCFVSLPLLVIGQRGGLRSSLPPSDVTLRLCCFQRWGRRLARSCPGAHRRPLQLAQKNCVYSQPASHRYFRYLRR